MSTPFEPIETAKIFWSNGLPIAEEFDNINVPASNFKMAKHLSALNGNELCVRFKKLPKDEVCHFVIGETSFGTGLNFLLTWALWEQHSPKNAKLHYLSFEKHPLPFADLAKCIQLWPALAVHAKVLLDKYPILTPGLHKLDFDEAQISLQLMLGDILPGLKSFLVCGDRILEPQLRTYFVDAWILDESSSIKKQSQWSEEVLTVINLLSKTGTTLTASSADNYITQKLEATGFKVTPQQRDAQNSKIICAHFAYASTSQRRRFTPWHTGTIQSRANKEAVIIGAGLAGCYTAHALAKRGWKVALLDASAHPASGASGNKQAILYPKLSAYKSPLLEFMLTSYLYAVNVYKNILDKYEIGKLEGILQLAYNLREQRSQACLSRWLKHYPELGRLVDNEEASRLAGISLQDYGLHIPDSGWLDARSLCELLIEHPNIQWQPNSPVRSIHLELDKWQVEAFKTSVVIIASGYQATQFEQTKHLPLKAIRGQLTSIPSNKKSIELNIPLCADIHILPERNHEHLLGATYHSKEIDKACEQEDDACNLGKLAELGTEPLWSDAVIGHWGGIRGATPDYLPLLGQVPIEESFKRQFSKLGSDSKRWIPSAGICYPGLFICAGFGSRGLTSIPLSAEWLAGYLNREPDCFPRHLIQAFSPARFLYRDIIHRKSALAI